jgi:hypothetical protein
MTAKSEPRTELNDSEMQIMAILCPRCSSADTLPYAGRQFCKQCGMTWRRNGEPDAG